MSRQIDLVIDLYKEHLVPVKLKQDDTTVLNFNITENGVLKDLTDCNFELRLKKPDNTLVTQTEGISVSNGIVSIQLIEDCLRVAGESKAELRILKDNVVISTYVFTVIIGSSLANITPSGNVATLVNQLNAAIGQGLVTKEQLDAWVGAHADIVELDNRVQENTSQLADISINIEKYRFLANNIGTDNEDWIPAINRALQDIPNGGTILIPNKVYQIRSSIQLGSYQKVQGSGRSSVIKLANNSNCSVIKLKSTSEQRIEIHSLTIDGNKDNQSSIYSHGLEIINDFFTQSFDSRHVIDNVLVLNVLGDGVFMEGRGESIICNVQCQEIGQSGFNINLWDSWFNNLSAGHCGADAFKINGSNLRFVNCKGWGSLGGYYITSKRSMFVSCEAQDVTNYGFKIDAANNIIKACLCDAVGWDFFNKTSIANATSYILTSNANNCIVDGMSLDRAEFSIDGTQCYAVDIKGQHCNLILTALDLLNGSVKDASNVNPNNVINIIGLARGSYTDMSYKNINSLNIQNRAGTNDGWVISGSENGSSAEYAYLAPIVAGVAKWDNGIRYGLQDDAFSINSMLYSRTPKDLGSILKRFLGVYLSSQLNINNGTNEMSVDSTSVVAKNTPLYLRGGTNVKGMFLDSNTLSIYGDSDNTWSLGSSSKRFANCYLVNAPTVTSKRELKTNIEKFDDTQAYEHLKNLNIYTYNFKKFDDDGNEIGVDAENMLGSILDELPIECINEEAQGVDLYAYTSYCISALKVAIAKIEELESEISRLNTLDKS